MFSVPPAALLVLAYAIEAYVYLVTRFPFLITVFGLKEPMYPEYIQGAASPKALAQELDTCLRSIDRLIATQTQAEKLRALLRRPAGGTVADWLARRMGI